MFRSRRDDAAVNRQFRSENGYSSAPSLHVSKQVTFRPAMKSKFS